MRFLIPFNVLYVVGSKLLIPISVLLAVAIPPCTSRSGKRWENGGRSWSQDGRRWAISRTSRTSAGSLSPSLDMKSAGYTSWSEMQSLRTSILWLARAQHSCFRLPFMPSLLPMQSSPWMSSPPYHIIRYFLKPGGSLLRVNAFI